LTLSSEHAARFIKTLKEEFCWCHRFASIENARLKLKVSAPHRSGSQDDDKGVKRI
jgi:hypothetical protein